MPGIPLCRCWEPTLPVADRLTGVDSGERRLYRRLAADFRNPMPMLTGLLDSTLDRLIAELEIARRTRLASLARTIEHSQQPLATEIPSALLKAEVEALPDRQCLIESSGYRVCYGRAAQLPWCLQEIGRLRELTFREVGEGTGKASDIDLFDAYYLHLFVWDTSAHAIVGAYRMGLTDEIISRYGKRGLYTHSLFKYRTQLLRSLGPTIELGRSFVRPEYQRSYGPLLMLWRGIGRFVASARQYAVLIGPVSISNDYAPVSRKLMVDFLSTHKLETMLSRHVRPRRPLKATASPAVMPEDIDAVSRLVAEWEGNGKGVPVLLKQYLKLGGRLLAFSVDPHFGDALDGLIKVDLRVTERRLLSQYMGEEAATAFLDYHGVGSGKIQMAS